MKQERVVYRVGGGGAAAELAGMDDEQPSCLLAETSGKQNAPLGHSLQGGCMKAGRLCICPDCKIIIGDQ